MTTDRTTYLHPLIIILNLEHIEDLYFCWNDIEAIEDLTHLHSISTTVFTVWQNTLIGCLDLKSQR